MLTTAQVLGLLFIFTSILVGVLLHHNRLQFVSKILSFFAIILNAYGTGLIVADSSLFTRIILILFWIFCLINYLRVIQGRMHRRYLANVTVRTTLVLGISQLIFTFLSSAANYYEFIFWTEDLISLTVVLLFLASMVLIVTTIKNFRDMSNNSFSKMFKDKIPSVTLAISARNEDESLSGCIESAINSDYPKLEIIVLDDESQDKTSEIIKSYAQSGVRFVQSMPADNTWLAKNMAYQKLFDEAAGEIIIFAGVDVVLRPQTISKMVSTFTERGVSMMGILPKRTGNALPALLIQLMRYWWEISTPRIIKRRQPVLSTCWMIKKDVLQDLGGFGSVARAVIPEEKIARILGQRGLYNFVISDALGVYSAKPFKDQWQTSIRTRYPKLHRRPENVFLVTIFVLLLLSPIFWLIFDSNYYLLTWWHFLIMTLSVILLQISFVAIGIRVYSYFGVLAMITFPIALILDLILLYISMLDYEFGTVTWKGRNISTPAMHVVPHLPSSA